MENPNKPYRPPLSVRPLRCLSESLSHNKFSNHSRCVSPRVFFCAVTHHRRRTESGIDCVTSTSAQKKKKRNRTARRLDLYFFQTAQGGEEKNVDLYFPGSNSCCPTTTFSFISRNIKEEKTTGKQEKKWFCFPCLKNKNIAEEKCKKSMIGGVTIMVNWKGGECLGRQHGWWVG